jgi:hypothetical protein
MILYYRKIIFGGPLKHVNTFSVKSYRKIKSITNKILVFVFVSFIEILKLIKYLEA